MRLLLTALVALAPLAAPVAPAGAIVGGRAALPGDAPWLGSAGSCTATLVAPDRVLTAAHCVEGTPPWRLPFRFGGLRRFTGRSVPVAEVALHPRVRLRGTPAHDVAVLALREPVADVEPLPVADAPAPFGAPVRTFGWGVVSVRGTEREPRFGKPTTLLRRADLRSLPLAECRRFWRRHRPEPLDIPGSTTCARAATAAPCLGDSGAPLVHDRDGVPELVGVFSWTHRCGDERDPGAFITPVSALQLLERPVWAPFPTSRPRVLGVARPGGLVRCGGVAWTHPPTSLRVLWRVDGREVQEAALAPRKVRGAEAGRRLTCVLRGSTAGGASRTLPSPAVRVASDG